MPPKSKQTIQHSRLTATEIENIRSSYPPLTEDEFRYSLIAMNVKCPDLKDPSIFIVSPIKTNPDWNLLSSMTHKCYIKHRIPAIINQAPTIEQWYQELRVYPDELDLEKPPTKISSSLFAIEPKHSFFMEANINFASSKNCRKRKQKGRFVYYYYVEPETNNILHLAEPEARQLYCKKFEQSIMFEKSPARPVFETLWKMCMRRSRHIPIVFRGYGIDDNLVSTTRITEKYHDYSKSFSNIYCLTEMLLKFPHLENCIWNREIPMKTNPVIRKAIPLRPTVVYTNPHIGKVYECDMVKEEKDEKDEKDGEDGKIDIDELDAFIDNGDDDEDVNDEGNEVD